ncbi:hypothetical protein [uncultured Cohaesibacter sp.]|uniref:hypothetical protein n=1 Tax=uncultured Cohaesibacter sp. TaxID=1002546 RepID=UPI0029C60193|nr:hypothetical protein [uncultured Cohaesibacter sp.]
MLKFIDKISVGALVVVALTLGLAPFTPEPHVWQKLKMLVDGSLVRPIDMFDLLMHGFPWLLLVIKLVRQGLLSKAADK